MNTFYVLFLVLFPIISSIIVYILGKKKEILADILTIIVSVLEMIVMILALFTYKNFINTIEFAKIFGTGLSFKLDGFRILYSFITVFMWFITSIFSKQYMKNYKNHARFYLFYLITFGSVVGVFLSNDFLTTFLFFEVMSFASFFLVLHDEKEGAIKGAISYLSIAVISGMILLMGLFMLQNRVGSVSISMVKEYYMNHSITGYDLTCGILLMFGFGAKAGLFPLHTWLPAAHPVAPSNASSLLSGIITKTGVFGIIVIAANMFMANVPFGMVLLVFAVITMVLGAILALFSTNLKRTLACSSMSQISFALVGLAFAVLLGEDNTLAASGSLLHLVNHSLIKLVLFSIAGVVVMNLEELDLNKVRGFGRNKYAIMIAFGIAALGLMGVPFFNGYVSKTLMHEGILEYISTLSGSMVILFKIIEYTFLATGGITIAYMAKLFICLFIEKNEDSSLQEKYDNMKSYLSVPNKIAILGSSIVLLVIGLFTNLIDVKVINSANDFFGVTKPLAEDFKFFSLENLKGSLISIVIGILVYTLIVRLLLMKNKKYINVLSPKLDLEKNVYKPLLMGIYNVMLYISFGFAYLLDGIILLIRKTILKPFNYEFKEVSLAYHVGSFIDKHSKKEHPHYAEKADDFMREFEISKNSLTTNFSFALIMIVIGVVLVLLSLLI